MLLNHVDQEADKRSNLKCYHYRALKQDGLYLSYGEAEDMQAKGALPHPMEGIPMPVTLLTASTKVPYCLRYLLSPQHKASM